LALFHRIDLNNTRCSD